jgi:hypothetical protein
MTKIQIRDWLKNKLATSDAWALRALVVVMERQTDAEKVSATTTDANGVGFSGCDAEILTSFANQYATRGSLSPKQMALVFKKMPRYWGQILPLIPADKLPGAEKSA